MNSKHKHLISQIKKQKKLLLTNDKTGVLSELLNSEECQRIIENCREFRDRVYNPLRTLCAFIKQILHSDKSCKNAVSGVLVDCVVNNEEKPSENTSSYCKARARFPEEAIAALVTEVGGSAVKNAKHGWKWNGREVKLVDGTTLLMPDTKANQAAFPQHKNQKKGVGFPILRLVVIMSLTVGTIMGYAASAFKGKGTGEQSLLRSIFASCINELDVLLGDRYYPCFFLLADLLVKGADGVFRGQSQRHYDFRKGIFLGKKDHLVDWKKPPKPDWMEQATYDAYPDYIQIREFKVAGNVYITTFLDPKKYHKKELQKLYQQRWQIEINLKSIKAVMKMDMLSCKSPAMVKKEVGIHFLGYNLIRVLVAEACIKYGGMPNKISFKGTVQLLNHFAPRFSKVSRSRTKTLYSELLKAIVRNKVGNRPGRVEPRAIKRRGKPFPLLNKPRVILKKRLMRKLEKTLLKEVVYA